MRKRSRLILGLAVPGVTGAVGIALYLFNRHVRQGIDGLILPTCEQVKQLYARKFHKTLPGTYKAGTYVKKGRPAILDEPQRPPLTSVAEFLAWTPQDDPDAMYSQGYNAPLHQHDPPQADPLRPKLLVCHDMMGGYLQDRFTQGASDPGYFRLWQWEHIDVFVYFSHHLITIPPPGWTAAAHRNGTQVLGTFITEWSEGTQRCMEMFATRESAQQAAEQLVKIAKYFGFEGWLINIENSLPKSLLPNLLHFVAHLRVRMHAEVQHALVMWYDALNTLGRLGWQNGLTDLNYPFFDAADALFVNYKWQQHTPAEVAAAAGHRAADVYMGVDVFGRNTFGGGKDNCPMALAEARLCGLSAALFAPGWVYEEFEKSNFEARQDMWWSKIRSVWPSRPAQVSTLPLLTHFDSGCGRGSWLESRKVSTSPWYSLALQDPQAVCSEPPIEPLDSSRQQGPSLRVTRNQQYAYTGGACLSLQGSVPAGQLMAHKLYSCSINVPRVGVDVSYIAASQGASKVAVALWLTNGSSAPPKVVVVLPGSMLEGPGGPGMQDKVAAAEAQVHAQLSKAGYSYVVGQSQAAGTSSAGFLSPGRPAPAPKGEPPRPTWLHHTAHLTTQQLPGDIITAVGLVCLTSPPAPAAGSKSGSSASSSTGDAPFSALLGQLAIREHNPGPTSWPLTGLACSSVQWTTAAPHAAPAAAAGALATRQARDAAPPSPPLRLLTCELSWPAQFDSRGRPRHHSYHLWAHMGSGNSAPSGGSSDGLSGSGLLSGRASSSGMAAADEGHWEVVHSLSKAVWLGETAVAAYRVVRLEVPVGCSGVTLLVQAVTAEGEVQPLQVVANIVPQ